MIEIKGFCLLKEIRIRYDYILSELFAILVVIVLDDSTIQCLSTTKR